MSDPTPRVEMLRFFGVPGSDDGTVTVVVGGKMLMFRISRTKMFSAAESAMEALRYAEAGPAKCAVG